MSKTRGQIIYKIRGRKYVVYVTFFISCHSWIGFFYVVAKLYTRTKTNSIKKENCDYRFIQVDNVKTRSKMSEESNPIDRHKTAACMMYAILKTRVFEVNYSVPNLPYVIRLANEYLAFFVALNMIEQYKRTDQKKKNEKENYQLVIPETKYEVQKDVVNDVTDSNFIISMCLTLANIKNIDCFDTFAYATILFLLEINTDNLLQYKTSIKAD